MTKRIFATTVFFCSYECLHAIPRVAGPAGLAAESKLVRETLCRSHPHVLDEMVRAERQRPETSTMAFLLFHKEDAATRLLVSLLNEHGWILVCPIFDGVIAVPGPETVPGTEDAIVQEFEDQTNLRLSSKPVHSWSKNRPYRNQRSRMPLADREKNRWSRRSIQDWKVFGNKIPILFHCDGNTADRYQHATNCRFSQENHQTDLFCTCPSIISFSESEESMPNSTTILFNTGSPWPCSRTDCKGIRLFDSVSNCS